MRCSDLLSAGLLATIAYAAPAAISSRGLSFDYDNDKVRGVCLGGWFVLEPWITPSLFEPYAGSGNVVDEYSLSQAMGKSKALSTLQDHWDSWITEDDFKAIHQAGLNHVRIPVGYWAVSPLSGDPYVQGQLDVLDKAVGWARNAGLKVMIDLHGVKGSQNGFDNSGRKGAIDWQQADSGAQHTIGVIKKLSTRYANQGDVVTLIELVNEPLGTSGSISMDGVKKYYYDGWGSVRQMGGKDMGVVIHDAFQPDFASYWNGFMDSGVNNVMVDTHQYQVFDNNQLAQSNDERAGAACAIGDKLASADKWTVVGEWTGAQTDCARWLNGLGVGARYDGTYQTSSSSSQHIGDCSGKYSGSVAGLSSQDKQNIRQFVEVQLDAYERRTGWFFWCWKTESAPEWHMKDLIANGLVPQPLTSRKCKFPCEKMINFEVNSFLDPKKCS